MATMKNIVAPTLALLDEGLSYSEIARRLDCSRTNVRRLARRYRPDNHGRPGDSGVQVPFWLSSQGLADDYRDHAAEHGEEAATRHCLRLLDEARAADRIAA